MNIQSLGNVALASFPAPRPNPIIDNVSASINAQPEPLPATNVTEQALQALQATSEIQPSRQDLNKAVKAVNDFVSTVNSSLKFSVDDDTGQTVVKVIDDATKEVIKQFPSEQMLEIAKALDSLKGLLVQQKA
jgi:flagellar protein FlaG